jgi:3-oxoacyl-[acyl-carrier protein] reductase
MTSEQWRTTLGTNLDSVFGVVRSAVAQMTAQPQVGSARGHIVLISSTAGQRGEAFHADYAATKGALISLTKSLSSELIGEGIYCNCVAPGWVATEATAGVLSDPEVSKKLLSLIPLGRPADVDEIAAPVLFLCTPFAGFISGEIFNVNGGAVLAG